MKTKKKANSLSPKWKAVLKTVNESLEVSDMLPIAHLDRIARALANAVTDATTENGRQMWPGFGSFRVVSLKARLVQADGIWYDAPARKVLRMRSVRATNARVNTHE